MWARIEARQYAPNVSVLRTWNGGCTRVHPYIAVARSIAAIGRQQVWINEKCSPERAFLRKSALCKEHFRDDRFRNGSGKSETLVAGVLAPVGVALEDFAVDGE